MTPLPADVLAALERGKTIDAIKLLRAATGLGLKEAKDLVDAHLRGRPVAHHEPTTPLPVEVVEALQRGDRIEAIRRLRDRTGLGLKEAHDAIEVAQGKAMPSSVPAPGEVRRSGSVVAWWVVALAIVGAVAIYFLRNPR